MKARAHFRECIQDSQEYGSDDQHMVSRLLLDLEVGDERFDGLHVDIKQVAGGDFENDPIEVRRLQGPRLPRRFNYDAFRDAAEGYYRDLVGSQGRVIHMEGGAKNVRMYGNRFRVPKTVEFEVGDAEAGW